MSFQAYIDTVQAKTGKTPGDFRALAQQRGLSTHGEIVTWLKADFELGHGHANAIAHLLTKPGDHEISADNKVAALFTGGKAVWRPVYDELWTQVSGFGPDVAPAPTQTYVSFVRGGKKFAIVQPSGDRLDIGLKLKGAAPEDRLEAAGSWNTMVTHRVRLNRPGQADAQLHGWLRQAYDQLR